MEESPSADPPEYGAANYPLTADASFSNLNLISSSTASQQSFFEIDAFDWGLILSPEEQLGHQYDDFILGAASPELLSPAPAAHEILISSNGSGTSTNRPYSAQPPAASSWLQASTSCNLQPQVRDRSSSLTIFVDQPPAPPLKVVQLQCLPDSAENMAYIDVGPPHDPRSHRHVLYQSNADFSFHPNPNNNGPGELFDELCINAYSDMPPGPSTMDTHNHPHADAALISVDKIPKLVDVQGDPSQLYLQARGFSTASAAKSTSLTYTQTSMADFVGVSISGPVSLTPSVNKGAPANIESFHGQIVEDHRGASVRSGGHGNQVKEDQVAVPCKTQLYKDLDKFAWRKQNGLIAQGGMRKRRLQNSRRTASCLPAVDPHSSSENATQRIGTVPDQDKDNSTAVMIRVKTEKLNLDDGYVWRKYGEKSIKGEKFSRNYLKCEESKRSSKCGVLKQTQRCSDDEDYVHFLYIGSHNHPASRPSSS